MSTNPYQPPGTEKCLRSVLLWTAITFAALGLVVLVAPDAVAKIWTDLSEFIFTRILQRWFQ
jgi:hypothetical protein